MSQRFMVRMYEAKDQSGSTDTGTLVQPVDRAISIYASTSDEAERALHRDVWNQKLPAGKVYQVCPFGNAELIRSISFALDGTSHRVFLDPASGPYGELRRIRLPRGGSEQEALPGEQLDLFSSR